MSELISYEFITESSGFVVMAFKGSEKKIPFKLQKSHLGFELNGDGLNNQNINFKNNQLIIHQSKIGKAIYIKSN